MADTTQVSQPKHMAPTSSGEVEAPLNARVLLAERGPVDRLVFQEMLEQLGCRTDIVGDGRDAVKLIATSVHACSIECRDLQAKINIWLRFMS